MGGHKVAYFTSENTPDSLISQMDSIGLGVVSDFEDNNLAIMPIEDSTSSSDPERSMASLGQVIEHHSSLYNVLIVDAITNFASYSQDKTIVAFFSALKRLCNDETTIIVVGHSHAFDEKMLTRLKDLCDAYLSLRVEKIGVKLTSKVDPIIKTARGLN